MSQAANSVSGLVAANDSTPAAAPMSPAYVLDFAAAQKLRDIRNDQAREQPSVWIYQPCRNVNQHGTRPRCWVLEFAPASAQKADALMGWIGHGDPRQSLRLTFPTKSHAIAFARRQGWNVVLAPPEHGAARIYDLDVHRRVAPSVAGLGQWHAVL
jgi:hypothetical protein